MEHKAHSDISGEPCAPQGGLEGSFYNKCSIYNRGSYRDAYGQLNFAVEYQGNNWNGVRPCETPGETQWL